MYNMKYFFRRFFRNIIKWWCIVYNPVKKKVSFSKEDEEYTAKLEAEKKEKEKERQKKYCEAMGMTYVEPEPVAEAADPVSVQEAQKPAPTPKVKIEDANYNETTGSFSGLYGQGPMDDSTKSALDAIMGKSNKNAFDFDALANQVNSDATANSPKDPPKIPEDQAKVLDEANAIYERLMREAAEDEAKKQAEIDAAKASQQ